MRAEIKSHPEHVVRTTDSTPFAPTSSAGIPTSLRLSPGEPTTARQRPTETQTHRASLPPPNFLKSYIKPLLFARRTIKGCLVGTQRQALLEIVLASHTLGTWT